MRIAHVQWDVAVGRPPALESAGPHAAHRFARERVDGLAPELPPPVRAELRPADRDSALRGRWVLELVEASARMCGDDRGDDGHRPNGEGCDPGPRGEMKRRAGLPEPDRD